MRAGFASAASGLTPYFREAYASTITLQDAKALAAMGLYQPQIVCVYNQ
jgi:hypothetical protein